MTGVIGLADLSAQQRPTQQAESRMLRGPSTCPGEGGAPVPLSGSISDIPEFHDCQRFIKKRPMLAFWLPEWQYDSLYAVFASFRLDNLAFDLDTSPKLILPSGEAVPNYAVATIVSVGGTYRPLGIRPGSNCLLLYKKPASDTAPGTPWGAKMIPLPAPRSSCLQGDVNPNWPGTLLQVHASSVPSLGSNDYPAVARWDWDSVHNEQYIGIKCLAAWCQIGREGFDTSASYAGPDLSFTAIGGGTIAPNELKRVTSVRGWYDEQRLAGPGSAGPSTFHGVLVPNPKIHNLNKTPNKYDSTWVQVGFAVVLGGDYNKWNMRSRVNEFFVCRGSCRGVPTGQPPVAPSTMALASCTTGWWAKVVPHPATPGNARYLCFRHTDHSPDLAALSSAFTVGANTVVQVSSSIPGTARWRWLLDDEATWFGCTTSSCCTQQQ